MKKSVIVCVAFLLSGCASVASLIPTPTPIRPIAAAFDESAVAWAKGAGTAAIEGQAFLKTRGGDVKYGAGNEVMLVPVSPHTTEWFDREITQGEKLHGPDVRIAPYVRTTTSDGSGHFKFTELPAGDYFVVTTVTWEVPSGRTYYQPMDTQGGQLGMKVKAEAGKSHTIIVTR